MESTGVLHCLSSVTALKGEHATHCGEPDCSGVIDQLPGVIPRYRAAETNAGKNTRNLLSPLSSRRQGESSSFPQAKTLNTGRDAAVMYFFLLVQIHALTQSVVVDADLERRTSSQFQDQLQRGSISGWRPEQIKITTDTSSTD